MTRPTHRWRLLVGTALSMAVVTTGCAQIETLSTAEALDRMTVASTKVYAADGSLIANLHGEIDRDIVPLREIPKHTRDAVIAIEDRRFWDHHGLDMQALFRAAVANVRGKVNGDGRIQGGSTISQQLVKNLYFPKPERTISRKIAEARLTLQFENQYEKPKILEMYLNTVYFGRGVYGVQAAARSYFRKDVQDLTVAESAYLAGLIHEPGRYEWRDGDPPEKRESRRAAALSRRNTVIGAMQQIGALRSDQRDQALRTPLEIESRREDRWRYPYFVDAVLRELGVLRANGGGLNARYDVLGETAEERAAKVYRGGLRIYTTVDPRAQEGAERAVEEIVPSLDKLSAALVGVDPKTGHVRALVGGRDYYPAGCDVEAPAAELSQVCRLAKVNLALGEYGGGSGRQPGSSFKPLVLAAALTDGITLKRRFDASPFTHDLEVGQWRVRNYEGSGGGSMPLIDATVNSVNAVYARLEIHGLGEGDALKGAGKVADVARRMGFDFPTEQTLRERCGDAYGQSGACTPADAVPAIALGAKEVSPLQLASAYGTFANEGVHVDPTTIARIVDADGTVIYESDAKGERAIDAEVAAGVTHVLQKVISSGTGTRADIDRPAAGKTGTAQMWRDAWFAGYVPQLVAVAWVGNPIPVRDEDGAWGVESMTPSNGYPRKVVGGSYPAMMWRSFMQEALEGIEAQDFPDPPKRFFEAQRGETEEDEDDEDPAADSGTETGVTVGGMVPSVIGQSPASARITLQRAGYGAAQTYACPPGGGGGGMTVWRQSPGGGSSVPPGATVQIWISRPSC